MKTANRSSNKRESSYGMTGRAFNAEIDPLIAVIDLRKRFKSLEVLKGIEPPVPAFLGSAGNRVMYGIIALTINSGGYICEIIRSGIESVDPGQMEAARSIGFGPVRSMMMIVVPQAVKNILPNFGNEFANLIKASSQVMVIGVAELMFTFNTISSTGRVFTPLIVIAFLYFVMTFTVGRGVHAMEKHFKKADR